MGKTYVRPQDYVLFSGQVAPACGFAAPRPDRFIVQTIKGLHRFVVISATPATEVGADRGIRRRHVIAHDGGTTRALNLLGITDIAAHGRGAPAPTPGASLRTSPACSQDRAPMQADCFRRRLGRAGQKGAQNSRARRPGTGAQSGVVRGADGQYAKARAGDGRAGCFTR